MNQFNEKIPTETGVYYFSYAKIPHAIDNGAALPVTTEEGLQVIKLLELGGLSHQ